MTHTPNTPANGGQILTDERIKEISATTFAQVQAMPDDEVSGDTWDRCFARNIETDLRATLVAVDVKAIHSAVLALQCNPANSVEQRVAFLAGVHRSAAVVSQFGAQVEQPAVAPPPVPGMPDLARLQRIIEEIAVTDLAYKQRDLATKALDILAAMAPAEQDELPITRSTYGSLEACEAEQARRNAALTEQAGELLPLPEMDSLADIEYAQATPEDWDADYRSTWQKLQLAERNKMQWRAYALQLRAARATPPAPTPAAAEGQAGAEISCDQCIELAEELQKEWMRKAIAETRTAASLFDEGGFRAGMETACDEIETRMALDAAPLPRQAAVQEQTEPTSIDIAKRMYGKWTDEQGIHCNRFPAFSELSTADQQKWITKARAAPAAKSAPATTEKEPK